MKLVGERAKEILEIHKGELMQSVGGEYSVFLAYHGSILECDNFIEKANEQRDKLISGYYKSVKDDLIESFVKSSFESISKNLNKG